MDKEGELRLRQNWKKRVKERDKSCCKVNVLSKSHFAFLGQNIRCFDQF